jgi:hypothetical protein
LHNNIDRPGATLGVWKSLFRLLFFGHDLKWVWWETEGSILIFDKKPHQNELRRWNWLNLDKTAFRKVIFSFCRVALLCSGRWCNTICNLYHYQHSVHPEKGQGHI